MNCISVQKEEENFLLEFESRNKRQLFACIKQGTGQAPDIFLDHPPAEKKYISKSKLHFKYFREAQVRLDQEKFGLQRRTMGK